MAVSTHAPAWGATIAAQAKKDVLEGFNSRARVGRDLSVNKMDAIFWGFNSRARVGRDRAIIGAIAQGVEFQLTRPRGARPDTPDLWLGSESFNSRARVGRDSGL